MKCAHRIGGVLLAIAAASMAIAAHAPFVPGAAGSGARSHLVARVGSSRVEATLVQVKSLDGHDQHKDNESRRLALGVTTGAAALAAAVMVTIIRHRRAHRFGLAERADVRVRAPPGARVVLT